jgi:hypothetical protein
MRGGECRGERLAQRRAVGQAGERIEVGEPVDPPLGGDAVAHVLLDPQEPDDRAILVTLGGKRHLVPEGSAVAAVVDERHVRVTALGECLTHDVDRPWVAVRALQHVARPAQQLGGGVPRQPLEPLRDVDEWEARLGGVGDDDPGEPFTIGAHSPGIGCGPVGLSEAGAPRTTVSGRDARPALRTRGWLDRGR